MLFRSTPPTISLSAVSGGTYVRITNNDTIPIFIYDINQMLLDIIGPSNYDDLPFSLFGGSIVISPQIYGSCYFCYDTEFLTLTTCPF